MSKDGREKAMQKAEVPADGGLFGTIPANEQKQRRAAQAFCKMLARNDKRTEDSFVQWVDKRAKLECGPLYSLVENRVKDRLAKNARLRQSQENSKND